MKHYKTDANIHIRTYRHPDDFDAVRRLYVLGNMHGPGAPYTEAISRLTSHNRTGYYVFTLGILGICIATANPIRGVALSVGLNPSLLHWCASGTALISALASVFFWYYRWKFGSLFQGFVEQALTKDLGDIVTAFKLQNSDDGSGLVPSGPSGFWVAEDNGEVIGCIGLDNQTKNDPSIGEVRRLTVSPHHRRRGVGDMLMDKVIDHGRAAGLAELWLSTSILNTAAIKMYERNGWTVDKVKRVNSVGLIIDAVSFRMRL